MTIINKVLEYYFFSFLVISFPFTLFEGGFKDGRAPVDLRSQINLPAPEHDLEKQVEQTVNVYNLRRGRTLVKNIIPETKYETLTFKHYSLDFYPFIST